MSVKIVFATCKSAPRLQPSDGLAADALERRGMRPQAAAWNGDQAPFKAADVIVLRSTWDYHRHPSAFRAWLADSEIGAKLVNPPGLVYWGLTKRYLRMLQLAGAALPPTRFAAPNGADISSAMDALDVRRAVVKPVIGATASGLSLVDRGDEQAAVRAAAALGGHAAIVQPVLREISDDGEYSLMVFGGVFSHAVRKRPRPGDIRSQSDFGATTTAIEPSRRMVRVAEAIVAMAPQTPVYARVDLVQRRPRAQSQGGGLDEPLQLMELEVIEPELFFTHAPEDGQPAANRFAAAILSHAGANA